MTNEIKTLWNKYSLAVLILAIIIAGTLMFIFALQPSLEVFRLARQQANDIEAQYQSLSSRMERASAISVQTQTGAPAEIEKLQSIFIKPPELAHLMAVLETNAKTARFLVTALEIGSESSATGARVETGPLRQINVHLQIKGGGYKNLKEFFKLITLAVPLLDVSSFTFDPKSASASINIKAQAVRELQSTAVPFDVNFFKEPIFRALNSPIPAPSKDPVGRADPFEPLSAPATSE